MKKAISLILALILICTLPAMFASDDADIYDHDHDCDCDHEHLRVNDPWCDFCQNYTSLYEVEYGPYFDPYDDDYHLVTFYYFDYCSNCNNLYAIFDTDSLEGHSFTESYIDENYGFHRVCGICSYVEPEASLAIIDPTE